jgi:S1-C subfamily serine protease
MARRSLIAVLLGCLVLLTAAAAADLEEIQKAWLKVVNELRPSAVAVTVNPPPAAHPLIKEPQASICSGVIIDNAGHILTISREVTQKSGFSVELANGSVLEGKLVASDDTTGIAVLKVSPAGLTPAKFGNSGSVSAGGFIVTVSNTFGLSGTVSYGHIEGVERELEGENDSKYFGMIQVSTPVSDGDPGAPVAGIDGRVIALLSPVRLKADEDAGDSFSRMRSELDRMRRKMRSRIKEPDVKPHAQESTGGRDIHFAVPIDFARFIASELIEHGRVRRGRLGLLVIEIEAGKMEKQAGVLVKQVLKNTPADKAGILTGDVITAFAGKPIKDFQALEKLLQFIVAGETYPVTVLRNEKEIKLNVTPVERKPANIRSGKPNLPDTRAIESPLRKKEREKK